MVRAVQDDHAMMQHYDAKYAADLRPKSGLPRDLVTRIGLQVMAS